MKGIVFNLLEEYITDVLGEDAHDAIVSECALITREPFIGPGTYPDEDLVAIMTKASERTRQPVAALIRVFGRYAFPKLASKFPSFVIPYSHPKDFLKTVDQLHFTEVKKLYEDATPPHFIYSEPSEEMLVMVYRSARRLCPLMEGLIEGVSDYFKAPVKFSHPRCMHRGDTECEFQLSFPPRG